MTTLGNAFPEELKRVRDIHAEYVGLGINGRFGAIWIGELLEQAESVYLSGDTVEMVRLYTMLKAVQ